ncbi:MAG: hypothetical protein AB7P34_20885 [Vicinamibacterales bacterium]
MIRFVKAVLVGVSIIAAAGCQSPTDPDDTLEVDDFLDLSVAPDPATAAAATDGRTYRVVRGNNQPDDILPYDWHSAFTVTATLNGEADDEDGLEFPVDITSVTVQVKQASGGIITPPPTGETEYSFPLINQVSGNRFAAASSSVQIGVEVWYDLPSLRKEAIATVNLAFRDDDGQVFTKAYDVKIAP